MKHASLLITHAAALALIGSPKVGLRNAIDARAARGGAFNWFGVSLSLSFRVERRRVVAHLDVVHDRQRVDALLALGRGRAPRRG